MTRKLLFLAGFCLSVAGALGFFTFADDLRHTGELAVAVGLLLAGIGAVAASFEGAPPLQWLSVAVLLGLLAGAAVDATAFGLAFGIAVGAVATWWRHHRGAGSPRPAA